MRAQPVYYENYVLRLTVSGHKNLQTARHISFKWVWLYGMCISILIIYRPTKKLYLSQTDW